MFLEFVTCMRQKYGEKFWKAGLSSSRKRKRDTIGCGPQLKVDLQVGREALEHCLAASWWEWKEGSSLLFWKWPGGLQQKARDGWKVWMQGPSLQIGDLNTYQRIKDKRYNCWRRLEKLWKEDILAQEW